MKKILLLTLIFLMSSLGINFASSFEVMVEDSLEYDIHVHEMLIVSNVVVNSQHYNDSIIRPMVEPCCNQNYNLVWRTIDVQHVYPTGGGLCLGQVIIGQQYCTNCGAIWQYSTVIAYIGGCGHLHGATGI